MKICYARSTNPRRHKRTEDRPCFAAPSSPTFAGAGRLTSLSAMQPRMPGTDRSEANSRAGRSRANGRPSEAGRDLDVSVQSSGQEAAGSSPHETRGLSMLATVMVAPITATVRGLPSEVPVGTDEGLKRPSAVNLDHVQTVDQSRLRQFVGTLSREQMARVCRALAIATGCAS